jgi:hypothetical protein
MIVEATKLCSGKHGCGLVLPASEFYVRKDGSLNTYCRACAARRLRQWKADNPERNAAANAAAQRKWRRNNPIAKKAKDLVSDATREGPSDIDSAWVMERLERGVCELKGIPFVYEKRHPFLPSVDRIDPKQPGHMKDNCRVILWCLNAFKGAASEEVFRECLGVVSAAPNQS